jgi:hypothetical protein
VGGEVEITSYRKDIPGHVDIPPQIDGKPVTAITRLGAEHGFDGAFSQSMISSATIPSTVIRIGTQAFGICFHLTSITIPDSVTEIGDDAFYQSNGLRKVTFGKSVRSIGQRAFFACFQLTRVALPDSLQSIGSSAFQGCTGLNRLSFGEDTEFIGEAAFLGCSSLRALVFPSRLSLMDNNCFRKCQSLHTAVFMGNAPTVTANLFDTAIPGFRIFFLPEASGFTTPAWRGFRSAALSRPITPLQRWMLENGLPIDTNPLTRIEGSDVCLLLAYALDLDVERPSAAAALLPDGPARGIRFRGNRRDIRYSVEISSNLSEWTEQGVSLTTPDEDGFRTASTAGSGTRVFFRILVTAPESPAQPD